MRQAGEYMDIVAKVLAEKDVEEAKRLLSEIHKEKAFLLSDYYLGADVLGEAAGLHALHIALISLIYGEVEAGGVTGLDLSLAASFSRAYANCGRVELPAVPDELAGFYKQVVEGLNELVSRLCSRS